MTEAPEFSRRLAVDRIGPAGLTQRIEATEAERAVLAARLGVPALPAFAATFHLRREEAGRIAAQGRIEGRIVRECVVSLDLFETPLAEDFSVAFVPGSALSDTVDVNVEGEDEIPYDGGTIDLGEAAAEQVALTLEPYPRRPGAELPAGAQAAPESPFAVLARRGRGL